jgi:5-aminopentanamidase
LERSTRVDQFRIALAQLEPKLFDKERNLAKVEHAIRLAAGNHAAAILFPELFLTGYSLGERAVELAETLDGPSVMQVAALAKSHHVAVIMGFAELSPDGRHAFDAMFVLDGHGRIRGSYHKMHLFHNETDWFQPGKEFSIIDFGLGASGCLICYDLEFPEAARMLALKGAKWIACSTGNMLPNQHLQEVFIQSRAAENRLWVAAANRVGSESGLEFFGGSAVADPTGVLVAQANDQETIIFADLDLRSSKQARENADYLADRHPDLYFKDAD